MEATFTYSGSLEGLWSYPVKISGEKGEPGAPGQPGAQRPSGPGICYRGDYDSFKYYNGTPTYVDVVRYAGRYYKANVTSGTFQGVHPMNTSKWELMNSFENVATRLLIAEEANISGWMFSNQYIVSQNRNVGLDGTAEAMHPAGSTTTDPCLLRRETSVASQWLRMASTPQIR